MGTTGMFPLMNEDIDMCKAKTLAWSPHSTQCVPGPLQPGCRVLGPQCQAYALLLARSSHTLNLDAPCQVQAALSQNLPKQPRDAICSSPSLPPPSNPLVMWARGSCISRRAKTSSFYQRLHTHPAETAASVHFYLYPLHGSFFVHRPVVFRASSHLHTSIASTLLGPTRPDAGFPNMPCWSEDEFILPEKHALDMVPGWLEGWGGGSWANAKIFYKGFWTWLKAALAMWSLYWSPEMERVQIQ